MLRIAALALLSSLCAAQDPEKAEDGWLGVYLADSETEARIAEVIPGSPAEAAGLKPGDVFLEVDGEITRTVEAFAEAAESFEAGARVRLRIRRDGEEVLVEVKLVSRPGEIARVPAFLGVAVVPSENGVLVNEVLVDSPAAAGGISPGDRIVRLHGQQVSSLDDVERIMKGLAPGSEIAVNVQTNRGSASLMIRLGARPAGRLAGRRDAAGPGAAPAPGGAPRSPEDLELEARLERAGREVERLGRELELLIELGGEVAELQRLGEELRELRQVLGELLQDR